MDLLLAFIQSNVNITSMSLHGNFIKNSVTRDIASIGLANLVKRRKSEGEVVAPAAAGEAVASGSSLEFLMLADKKEDNPFPSLRVLQSVLLTDH